MLEVHADEIARLRSPGGDRFAAFVNDLLLTHASACGIPASDVIINIQTTAEDGGVDSEIRSGGSDPLGWLVTPTAWQFKGTSSKDAGPATLAEDIQKCYATERVKDGFAYYCCICDHLTQREQNNREKRLQHGRDQSNPSAPLPRVLDANALATIANRYPALVLRHFHSEAQSWCVPLATWKTNSQFHAPTYIADPAHDLTRRRITTHLMSPDTPEGSVLVIRGESGIGKSRLACEAVLSLPSASSLTIATADEEDVLRLATYLINANSQAIVIADEMRADDIARLRDLTRARTGSVRIIAIESVKEEYRKDDEDGEWVSSTSNVTLEKVLEANYPLVASERRRGYVAAAGGSVRFAIELCLHDEELKRQSGPFRPSFLRDYIRLSLATVDREALEALSLVEPIGWKNEVADELRILCNILDIDHNHLRRTAERVSGASGFIATSGRYCYVHPPVVAQLAFESAWRQWGAPNPAKFLDAISQGDLLAPFLRQVSRVGTIEARRTVATHFERWAESLAADDIGDVTTSHRLLKLVEVDPVRFLPLLSHLVEAAPDSAVTARIYSHQYVGRHELVRIATRLANRREHFHHCEAILFRIGKAEVGTDHYSGAASAYKQLFKIFLSGTPIPFGDRLHVLERRSLSQVPNEIDLVTETLCAIFGSHHSRGLDDPIIAGYLPNEDWAPSTYNEWNDCLTSSFALLVAIVRTNRGPTRQHAWKSTLPLIARFRECGFSSQLQSLYPPTAISNELRVHLILSVNAEVAKLLKLQITDSNNAASIATDIVSLQHFLSIIRTDTLLERIHVLLQSDSLDAMDPNPDSAWRREARTLSRELSANPDRIASHLDALCDSPMETGFRLGQIVGRDDTGGKFFEVVGARTTHSPTSPFVLGFMKGYGEQSEMHRSEVVNFIKQSERHHPDTALYCSIYVEESDKALYRITELINGELVPPGVLASISSWLQFTPFSLSTLTSFVQSLLVAGSASNIEAMEVGIATLHYQLDRAVEKEPGRSQGPDAALLGMAWEILERYVSMNEYHDNSDWAALFDLIRSTDSPRSIAVAVSALASGSHDALPVARTALVETAKTRPMQVMDSFGKALLDDSRNHYFATVAHSEVVAAIGSEVVKAWLGEFGDVGATAIAWHLPLPVMDDTGQARLPQVSELVLVNFGHVDYVAENFARSAVTGGEYRMEEVFSAQARREATAELVEQLQYHHSPHVRNWAHCVKRSVTNQTAGFSQMTVEDEERRFD